VLTEVSKKKFEEIYSEIEKISEEYFHDIQDKVKAL